MIELQPVCDRTEICDIGCERARRNRPAHRDHAADSLRPVGAAHAFPEASDSADDDLGRAGRASGDRQAVRTAIDEIRVEGDSSSSSKVAGESHCIGDIQIGPDIKRAGHAQCCGCQRVRARSEGNHRTVADSNRLPSDHIHARERTRHPVERQDVGGSVAAVKRSQSANVRANEGQAFRIGR